MSVLVFALIIGLASATPTVISIDFKLSSGAQMWIGGQRGNFYVSTISNFTTVPDINYRRFYSVAGKSD